MKLAPVQSITVMAKEGGVMAASDIHKALEKKPGRKAARKRRGLFV
jgi:hypothetical protein